MQAFLVAQIVKNLPVMQEAQVLQCYEDTISLIKDCTRFTDFHSMKYIASKMNVNVTQRISGRVPMLNITRQKYPNTQIISNNSQPHGV